MRQDAFTKARRIVAEGRLTLHLVDQDVVEASCRGDAAVHNLGFDEVGFYCSCRARGRCSHLIALGLVVVIPTTHRETGPL